MNLQSTIRALNSIPAAVEPAEPDYVLLNDYLSAHWRYTERPDITDVRLIQLRSDLSGPLLGIAVNEDLPAMVNRLLPCLDHPELTTLLYKCVRCLRYISGICGDDTLKQEIENALAVAV